MDLRKVRKLVEIFNESGLTEIEITEGEEAIRLTRVATGVQAIPIQAQVAAPDAVLPPAMPETTDTPPEQRGTFKIHSPMVGTFFTAPNPSDDPFVKVGDKVEEGQPLCLIEAMKIFNQIDADRSGIVREILKQNSDPVEFGEPLFVLSE